MLPTSEKKKLQNIATASKNEHHKFILRFVCAILCATNW